MKVAPCIHCGQPEADHCIYEFSPRLDGCQCGDGTWPPYAVRPICERYVAGRGTAYCATCEHDAECHGQEGRS